MTISRLFSVTAIVVCTAIAWFILGGALSVRSQKTGTQLGRTVTGNWGAPLVQNHPTAFYIAPTSARARRVIQPENSLVNVDFEFDKKKKGLLWFRTYKVNFEGEYRFKNPTPISQTIYVNFQFPAKGVRFDQFRFVVGEKQTDKAPRDGAITEAIILEPEQEIAVTLACNATGLDRWTYTFGDTPRVRGLDLTMTTNFSEIDIPEGSESPTQREALDDGNWRLNWNYTDVIGARSIAMEMPSVTNPGPVASRITFFAPVSLVFFFTVLIILGSIRGINLHPMNYFMLAAGCFAFQLLFAYLVDLIPVSVAFVLSAAVSLVLVSGYLLLVAGAKFARIAAVAQFAYMILFSASFFIEGLTGITITIGAILTLALLMAATAKTDWTAVFARTNEKKKPTPPAVPAT